jgi:hypothetical protein
MTHPFIPEKETVEFYDVTKQIWYDASNSQFYQTDLLQGIEKVSNVS